MPTPDKNKAALEGLIAKANAATGGDDATVTDAVDTLIAGFGQGGGGGGDDVARSIVDRSITEYSDSEITTIGEHAFYNCLYLNTVDCPRVTTIAGGAFQLTHNFDTNPLSVTLPSVTTIGQSAFEKRKGMSTGRWENVTSLVARAFVSCEALMELYFPKLVTTRATQAFLSCKGLTVIPRTAFPVLTAVWVNFFGFCTNLTRAEFDCVNAVYQTAFQGCSNFKTLVLRYDGVAVLKNKNAFEGTLIASGTGYIYVPSAHIDAYKTATNWSVYADQFRALEDYTVDGTVNGDLDESKI